MLHVKVSSFLREASDFEDLASNCLTVASLERTDEAGATHPLASIGYKQGGRDHRSAAARTPYHCSHGHVDKQLTHAITHYVDTPTMSPET